MQTLLAKYLAKPTLANATRIAVDNRRHPMATCFLNAVELAILDEAIAAAGRR